MGVASAHETLEILDRIERAGAGALDTGELVALLLGIALDELAPSAVGELHAVLDDVEGRSFALSREARARVLALRELQARSLAERIRCEGSLEHSALVREFVQARLCGVADEVFACLFLDRSLRLIAFEELFRGGFDPTTAQLRRVARRALAHDAAALISVRRDPWCRVEADDAERHCAAVLVAALALVDVRVLDHVVVGRDRCVSFAQCGLL